MFSKKDNTELNKVITAQTVGLKWREVFTLRNKLINLIQFSVGGCAEHWAGLIADNLMNNDVIQVVRCNKCIHYMPRSGRCWRMTYTMGEDGFCKYGERKKSE